MKSRITRATDLTARPLTLDAVERQSEELEIDAAFHELGEKRWAEFLKTGKSVPFE